jgi:hypothetical protein
MWIAAIPGAGQIPALPPLLGGIFADMLLYAVPDASAVPGDTIFQYLFRQMRSLAPLFPAPSQIHLQQSTPLCFSPAANIQAHTFNDPVGVLSAHGNAIGHASRKLEGVLKHLQAAPTVETRSARAAESAPTAADVTAISAGIDVLVAQVQSLLGSHNLGDVIRVYGLLDQVHRMLAVLARAIELRSAAAARRVAVQSI